MADEKGGSSDDLAFEGSAFETLEKDFQEVLTELVGDKSLERFRQEYEKLHRALKKSHESEKRLIKKCRELNSEIVSNAAKVQTALKLSQEDQNTIAALKREIEKAWKMVDSSHEKEARAKETIAALKTEIANLSRLVEQGAGLSVGQENTVNALLKEKEELSAARDAQVEEIAQLKAAIAEHMQLMRAREAERDGGRQQMHDIKEQIALRKSEGEKETRAKEKLEKERKELNVILDMRAADIKACNSTNAQLRLNRERAEDFTRTQKMQTEKMSRELEGASARKLRAEQEVRTQGEDNANQQRTNDEVSEELRKEEFVMTELRGQVQSQVIAKNKQTKKLRAAEDERTDVRRQLETLQRQSEQLEGEVADEKRAESLCVAAQKDLQAEIEELKRASEKTADATQRQVDIVHLNQTMIKGFEGEIGNFKGEAAKQRKAILHLEKEREAYGVEASDANAKFAQALEEVKLREMTIVDLQKKIQEGDARLKTQQSLYEAVRSDRNLYSKNLIESQDEIAEMKRKFKIMNHQIEQLKEEIQQKDQAYVKEHSEHSKADKEKETLKNDLNKVKKQVAAAESTMKNLESEVAKLNHIISEADAERFRQKQEYEITINERDILGTQMIRRNDELALLYEKIKIMQKTVSQGEVAYRDKLEELRVLRLKLNSQRRELHIQKASSSNLEALRSEVYTLQNELLQDRTKVKALSEELENPNNTHRWRKLEGSDPGTYELLQKIQALQKRLICKTEEVVEKDLLIQEKDKLYVELKNILARQPGPEVAEQLSLYQQGLRDKTKSMKAVASEINMYQAQLNEYKYEMERLTRELQDVKRKYYEQKRRETLQRERERQAATMQPESLQGSLM